MGNLSGLAFAGRRNDKTFNYSNHRNYTHAAEQPLLLENLVHRGRFGLLAHNALTGICTTRAKPYTPPWGMRKDGDRSGGGTYTFSVSAMA